jgi:hypothetical protein
VIIIVCMNGAKGDHGLRNSCDICGCEDEETGVGELEVSVHKEHHAPAKLLNQHAWVAQATLGFAEGQLVERA